jgi:hypothetical protein
MPQQPDPTSPSLAVSQPPAPGQGYLFEQVPDNGAGPGQGSPTRVPYRAPEPIPRWLQELELLTRVLLQMCVGLAFCFAPWSGDALPSPPWLRLFWDQNPLFLHFPALLVYADNGAVRGIVSGLGILNLWIAFSSAIRQRNH